MNVFFCDKIYTHGLYSIQVVECMNYFQLGNYILNMQAKWTIISLTSLNLYTVNTHLQIKD
jgi:hypothetical protein